MIDNFYRLVRQTALQTLTVLLLIGFPLLGTGAIDNSLRVTSITSSNGNIVIRWQGGVAPYQLQRQTDLSAAWEPVGEPTTSLSATVPQSGAKGFFRVESVLSRPSPLETLTFNWSKDLGGEGLNYYVSSTATASDAAGNIFVAGSFIGQMTLGNFTLTSAGSKDVFVAKYSPQGNVLWAKRAGGSADDELYGLVVTPVGDAIITGFFQGTGDFGGTVLTSMGATDIFVAKLSAGGTPLFSKGFGGSGTELAFGITTDQSGNLFLTGYFSGNLFGDTQLLSAGGFDGFLAKLSPDGTLAWARRLGGTGTDIARSVACDSAGNIIIGGYFQGSANVGGDILTSRGSYDIFLAKYSGNDGTKIWSKSFGGVSDDRLTSVAVDQQDNIYMAGNFMGTIDLGATALTSWGSIDFYLAKFTSSGADLWARNSGGAMADSVNAVIVDANNNPVITGQAIGMVDFGGGWVSAGTGRPAYVAKYSPAGVYLWSTLAGGEGQSIGTALVSDSQGNIMQLGSFAFSVNFGGNTYSLPSISGYHSFLVCYKK